MITKKFLFNPNFGCRSGEFCRGHWKIWARYYLPLESPDECTANHGIQPHPALRFSVWSFKKLKNTNLITNVDKIFNLGNYILTINNLPIFNPQHPTWDLGKPNYPIHPFLAIILLFQLWNQRQVKSEKQWLSEEHYCERSWNLLRRKLNSCVDKICLSNYCTSMFLCTHWWNIIIKCTANSQEGR